jgi:hypothetical protein
LSPIGLGASAGGQARGCLRASTPITTHARPPASPRCADPQKQITLASKLPAAVASKLCPAGSDFGLAVASAAAPPASRRRLLEIVPAPSNAPGLVVVGGRGGGRRAAVTGWDQVCGGHTLLFVDAVPAPCDVGAPKAAQANATAHAAHAAGQTSGAAAPGALALLSAVAAAAAAFAVAL